MEDVLDVYTRPYDPARPLICLDETSRQLLTETRDPLPGTPGRPSRWSVHPESSSHSEHRSDARLMRGMAHAACQGLGDCRRGTPLWGETYDALWSTELTLGTVQYHRDPVDAGLPRSLTGRSRR